ncbi:MAG TPA: ABC-F family ATP-binding cassette domain-containing protein [Sporolactobacillaceae bacterium]|nr:ABC-F family ATP-binding cassette domain-containing protein [Sporolactobacillaceae bacterium]
MSLLIVEGLTKSYGDKVLFDHLSFTIEEKERIGLIGVNGTGKSSLLKAIAGVEPADAGEVMHSKAFQLAYLPQDPSFEQDETVLEYVFGGNSPVMKAIQRYEKALDELNKDPGNEKVQTAFTKAQQQMDDQEAWGAGTLAKTILTKLGVSFYEQPVLSLSGGQRKRVAMARALIQPADLLILDEPTNHLDNETIEWLEAHLQTYPGALLLVTHDRYFLNRVTTQIFELEGGKLYRYEGNYEVFLEKKAEREEQAMSEEQKRQNTLRRELAWLRRGAKARTTKQKARIDRVEALQEKGPAASQGSVEIALGSQRLGKKVIELKQISKTFKNKTLYKDFNYLVVPNERLGIIGPNGSGKTTLLEIMAGRVMPDEGQVETGETVKIGYYTQGDQEIPGSLRVVDYIKEVAEVIRTADGTTISAEQMLERFLFSRSAQWNLISRLSGGEKRRLYLLRVLMGEPNVLFLDEPTNDLDTETLGILEEYLDHFPGVVITVSHDRYFLDRVVEHLLVFNGEGDVRRFEGSYSDFLEVQKQEKELAPKVVKESEKPRKERRKKLSYKEQKEWEDIEARISTLEAKVDDLKKEIERSGSNANRAEELYREQVNVEAELEQAIERWTELSLLIEELEAD